jgi:hypothetical protein
MGLVESNVCKEQDTLFWAFLYLLLIREMVHTFLNQNGYISVRVVDTPLDAQLFEEP